MRDQARTPQFPDLYRATGRSHPNDQPILEQSSPQRGKFDETIVIGWLEYQSLGSTILVKLSAESLHQCRVSPMDLPAFALAEEVGDSLQEPKMFETKCRRVRFGKYLIKL